MRSFLILTLILSVLNISGQVKSPRPSDLVGEFVASDGYAGWKISLAGDGTFVRTIFTDCCFGERHFPGKYTVEGYLIRFVDADGSKSEKYIVNWGKRIYLVNDFKIFALAANLGLEPRPRLISSDLITTDIFIRRGDESVAVEGQPVTVDGSATLFTVAQIDVRITRKEATDGRSRVRISKGSAAGLIPNMCFVQKKKRRAADPIFCVASIETHSAVLEVLNDYSGFMANVSIGTALTNRIEQTR